MKTKQRSIKLKGIIKSLREVYRRQTRNKINIKKKERKLTIRQTRSKWNYVVVVVVVMILGRWSKIVE